MNSNIIKSTDNVISTYANRGKIKVTFDDSRGNPLAIVAFVFSLLGFFLLPIFGTLVGMTVGYIARYQADYKGKRGGFLSSCAITFSWIQASVLLLVGVVYLITFGTSLLFSHR
jgi:uncharacterized membrane protein